MTFDPAYSTQIYTEQGGAKKHIGPTGTLVVETGGKITPGNETLPGPTAALTSAAGTPAAGTIDVGAAFNQANINNNFATVVAQLNALLTLLKNVGITS